MAYGINFVENGVVFAIEYLFYIVSYSERLSRTGTVVNQTDTVPKIPLPLRLVVNNIGTYPYR
ncbi:hypothetical protein Hanom_Chr04g00306741 [Helianthus anomalus]